MGRCLHFLVGFAVVLGSLSGGASSAAAQSEDNTYTGWRGWSITWDSNDWSTPTVLSTTDGVKLIYFANEGQWFVRATVYSLADAAGNSSACLDILEARDEDDESVSMLRRTDDRPMPDTDSTARSRLYQYDYTHVSGLVESLVNYRECRPIANGFANVVVSFAIEDDGWEVMIPRLEALLTGLDVRDAGLASDAYTSPTWGFQITWDPGVWEPNALGLVVDFGDERLDSLHLDSDLSRLYIQGVERYDGDVEYCVEREAIQASEASTVSNWQPLESEQGQPVAGTETDRAFAAYALTYTPEGGDPEEWVYHIECRELVDGEAVLVFLLSVLAADYEAGMAQAQPVMGIPGSTASVSDDDAAASTSEVQTSPEAPAPSGSGAADGFEVGASAVVNDDVNLRAAPSPDAAVVAALPRGAEVTIIAAAVEGGGFTWWPVTDPATGTIGYLRMEFLSPAP